MNPNSFKCSWCYQDFPKCYDLNTHIQSHKFCDTSGLPAPAPAPAPSPPQIFNRLPSVDEDEVDQPSLTHSNRRSKVNDHDTVGLTTEEILGRQDRTSRYHPYLKPTNKGKEPRFVEIVDDNFGTLDLLREWTPISGLDRRGYDSGSSSSSPISHVSTSREIDFMNLNGGETLDLDLKLGF